MPSEWTKTGDEQPDTHRMVLGVQWFRDQKSGREDWAWGLWTWIGDSWIPPWPFDTSRGTTDAYMGLAPDMWRDLPDSPERGDDAE